MAKTKRKTKAARKTPRRAPPRVRTAPPANRKPLPPEPPVALPPELVDALAPDDRIVASNLSLHDLFQQQMTAMLDSSDMSEEQKQSVLVAMNCPCCGTGMSYTAKLRRAK